MGLPNVKETWQELNVFPCFGPIRPSRRRLSKNATQQLSGLARLAHPRGRVLRRGNLP